VIEQNDRRLKLLERHFEWEQRGVERRNPRPRSRVDPLLSIHQSSLSDLPLVILDVVNLTTIPIQQMHSTTRSSKVLSANQNIQSFLRLRDNLILQKLQYLLEIFTKIMAKGIEKKKDSKGFASILAPSKTSVDPVLSSLFTSSVSLSLCSSQTISNLY